MESEGQKAGETQPPLTRDEFERVWRSRNRPKSAATLELIRRYNAAVCAHPVSEFQLWRLEKQEAHAAWQAKQAHRYVSQWDDIQQPTYDRILIEALRLVHGARWRKVISSAEADRILKAATDILGPEAASLQFAEKSDALVDRRLRPNSRQALAATLGMLDIISEIRPAMRDRFMARIDPRGRGTGHQRG